MGAVVDTAATRTVVSSNIAEALILILQGNDSELYSVDAKMLTTLGVTEINFKILGQWFNRQKVVIVENSKFDMPLCLEVINHLSAEIELLKVILQKVS